MKIKLKVAVKQLTHTKHISEHMAGLKPYLIRLIKLLINM